MDELLKTRCTKGFLYVYPDRVTVELTALGVRNSQLSQEAK